MAINGIRYAFDVDSKLQYALYFKNNVPVSIDIFGAPNEVRAMLQAGTFTAVDDQSMNGKDKDGNSVESRPQYEISLQPNGNSFIVNDYKISGYPADEPMPSHHDTETAELARKGSGGFEMFEQEEQPRAQGEDLLNMFKGAFNRGVDQAPGTQTPPGDLQPGERRPGRYKHSNSALEKKLKDYSMDLTERARNGQLDPVVGRDKERKDIRQMLLRKKRASVMLTGEAGVGKSALADALALDIANGKAEAELANARVISLNLQAMNAGTGLRGSFEERLLPILEGLEERGGYINGQKVILFIDEIHSALTAGQAMGGTNAGEIMKPYLAREGLTCIGATTPEEYKKHIEKNKALVRRFQPYHLEEPGVEDALVILRGAAGSLEKHHRLSTPIEEEILKYAVKMTNQFMPTQYQPDKSLAIIDDAAATARADGRTEVTQDDVVTAVGKATGLKEDFLNQSDFERYAKLGEILSERVIGQPGVHEIAETLRSSRVGLTDDNAPRGAFLLPGPTGVGKTELAKALAATLTGDEDNLIRIDMGKYQEKHTVSSLIGAPPGYVGHDSESGGELTAAVRKKPFSIVVIDEVEKAHKDVMDVFLSVLDDGELKDSHGRDVDFRNTIFLFTSNLGAKEVQATLANGGIGFDTKIDGDDNAEEDHARLRGIFNQAIKKHFRPEMVNRLSGIVPFYNLEREHVGKILDVELKKVEKQLQNSAHGLQLHNASLVISQEVKDALAEKGYDKAFGARPLKRAIQQNLTNQLGTWIMENKADLTDRNRRGAFKIFINKIGENFKPRVRQNPKKKPKTNSPAA